MNEVNQYAAPAARLEREEDGIYGEVRPFSPRGRLGRIRYLFYSILLLLGFVLIGGLLGAGVGAVAGEAGAAVLMVLLGVGYIALIVFQFILIIQRCHDFNATGWLSLLTLVPLINWLFGLLLLFMPGTDGPNRYGPPPPPHRGNMMVVAVGVVVTVLVAGILAAIAIPAYNEYVNRARLEQMR